MLLQQHIKYTLCRDNKISSILYAVTSFSLTGTESTAQQGCQ